MAVKKPGISSDNPNRRSGRYDAVGDNDVGHRYTETDNSNANRYVSEAPFPEGILTIESDTFKSIGITWDLEVSEDTDHNATVGVEYKKASSGTWLDAPDLFRVDYEGFFAGSISTGVFNHFAGSLMFLTPGEIYDIRLTYSDPDGADPNDGLVGTFQATTRAIPVKPTGGTTYYADPAATGPSYDGSVGDPFETLAQADAVVSPGDVVELATGTYTQVLTTLSNGGSEAGGHVVYEAAAGATPVVYRTQLAASYIWFDNIDFTGITTTTDIAGVPADVAAIFRDGNAYTDIVITGCGFSLFTYGADLRGCARTTFMDNTGVGPDVGAGSNCYLIRTGGEGADNGPGSVIAFNTADFYGDNINAGADSDVYGNDSFDARDDTFGSDDEEQNVRIWGNRFTNWVEYTFTFQPQVSAPWYFMYNQCIGGGPFKLRYLDRNVLIGNTFIGALGQWGRHNLRCFQRNNIFFRNASGVVQSGSFKADDPANGDRGSQLAPSWNTDVDYDGYGNLSGTLIDHEGSFYSTLSGYATAVGGGVQANGTELAAADFTSLAGLDETSFITLSVGSDARGAGISVDNLADWDGATPDLGCRQYGSSAPQYGQRSSELTTALHLRADDWTKH